MADLKVSHASPRDKTSADPAASPGSPDKLIILADREKQTPITRQHPVPVSEIIPASPRDKVSAATDASPGSPDTQNPAVSPHGPKRTRKSNSKSKPDRPIGISGIKVTDLVSEEDKNVSDDPDTVTYKVNVKNPGTYRLKIPSSKDTELNIEVIITVPQLAKETITDNKKQNQRTNR